MHGFALDSLLSSQKRSMIAFLAKSKSVDVILCDHHRAKIKNHWSKIENTSVRTKFALNIIDRFFESDEGKKMTKVENKLVGDKEVKIEIALPDESLPNGNSSF